MNIAKLGYTALNHIYKIDRESKQYLRLPKRDARTLYFVFSLLFFAIILFFQQFFLILRLFFCLVKCNNNNNNNTTQKKYPNEHKNR